MRLPTLLPPACRRRSGLLLALLLIAQPAPAQSSPAAKTPRFEQDVLPLLNARCFKCHGAEKPKAGLDLRSKAGMLKGGESGAALVPGSAQKSLLFDLVSKGDMPPKKNAKLTADQLAVLKGWIDGGAPVDEAAVKAEAPASRVSAKDREFWSFRKPVRPPRPAVRHADRVRTPIDAFVLAKLEARGLMFSPDADRATLIRRATIDLVGLPPSPDEVDAFLADSRPDAYERLIDRLLASPHYGERWGRHWLDAAGYADSIGGDNDPGQMFLREGLWRYRDYVVRSLNADKPYDLFLREQIAGDEMEDWRAAPTLTPAMREHLIATGFLRTSVDHTFENELNRPFERYQVLHDTIENLTSNVLGLTVSCARCHDHKFDPIPQADYYGLLACLKPSFNPEAWIQPQNRHCDDVSPREKEQLTRSNADLDRQAAECNRQIAEVRRPVEQRLFEAKLAAVPEVLRPDARAARATEPAKRNEVQKYLAGKLEPLLKVMPEEVAKNLSPPEKAKIADLSRQVARLNARKRTPGKIQAIFEQETPPTYIFRRGNLLTPGAAVQPGLFAVLTDPGRPTVIPPPAPEAKARGVRSGRRTAWADWLTRPDHPLTARVFVNRLWQHHFGEGLVATPDNFGHLGARPTHPDLLDWLAVEFVRPPSSSRTPWGIKAMHKLLMTSTVYRQASSRKEALAPGQADPEAVDPGNQLLWRMRLRRVESEVVRDAVLAVGGNLDLTMGGPPIPLDPKENGLVVVDPKGLPTPTAQWRRSLYLLARRNYNLSILSVFDQPVMATNCTRRIASAVPLQSLMLLNDAFMMDQAARFAARVARDAGDAAGRRIELAFRLAFARPPTAKEAAASADLLDRLSKRYAGPDMPLVQAELQALARLCHMLLCANEFLYVG
jgi:hypothetical protein